MELYHKSQCLQEIAKQLDVQRRRSRQAHDAGQVGIAAVCDDLILFLIDRERDIRMQVDRLRELQEADIHAAETQDYHGATETAEVAS